MRMLFFCKLKIERRKRLITVDPNVAKKYYPRCPFRGMYSARRESEYVSRSLGLENWLREFCRREIRRRVDVRRKGAFSLCTLRELTSHPIAREEQSSWGLLASRSLGNYVAASTRKCLIDNHSSIVVRPTKPP